MNVTVAKTGFCFGIQRAYQRMNDLAARGEPIQVGHRCSGPHANIEWDVLQRIETGDPHLFAMYPHLEGLEVVHDADTLRDGDQIAVGYHGFEPELKAELENRGVVLHDYQCPFIARMNGTAETLAAQGYDLIAFGKPHNHHCLYAKRVAERLGRVCLIAEEIAAIQEALLQPGRKWACIGQVTGHVERWHTFVQGLTDLDIPVRVIDTVCTDSYDRQAEAAALAREVDVVIVVDDGGGASTSVYDTCRQANPRTYRYGTGMPLRQAWLEGATHVAVVGGIMVPRWVLESTARELQDLGAPSPAIRSDRPAAE
jgi:4-hydroxy-3-methylbut-2-enyl diphosphate reductase